MTVHAQDSIYLAGGNTYSVAPGGGGGNAPTGFSFAAGAGQVLRFSSVTGTWTCCTNIFNGPDGGPNAGGSTNLNSSGVISGIVDTAHTMFLVGVFLDNGLPGAAPASLNFSPGQLTESFTTLSPLIGQIFFIGDGLTGTGSGSTQTFNVPATATRLFLGVADGFNFTGDPSFYGDNNDGQICGAACVPDPVVANFTITADVPEPASFLLAGFALAAICLSRRVLR